MKISLIAGSQRRVDRCQWYVDFVGQRGVDPEGAGRTEMAKKKKGKKGKKK
jgi:hypothetical protein